MYTRVLIRNKESLLELTENLRPVVRGSTTISKRYDPELQKHSKNVSTTLCAKNLSMALKKALKKAESKDQAL